MRGEEYDEVVRGGVKRGGEYGEMVNGEKEIVVKW